MAACRVFFYFYVYEGRGDNNPRWVVVGLNEGLPTAVDQVRWTMRVLKAFKSQSVPLYLSEEGIRSRCPCKQANRAFIVSRHPHVLEFVFAHNGSL